MDNALTGISAGEATAGTLTGFPRIRLGVLATSTIDHLLPAIRVAGLRRRLLVDVYAGSFGQYRQELMNPDSALHAFKPEIILLSLTARETIAGVPLGVTVSGGGECPGAARRRSFVGCGAARARTPFNALVIQQTFLDVTEPLFGSYDRLVPVRRRSSRD